MKILHYSDCGDKNIVQLFNQSDVLFTTGDLSIFDLNPLSEIISSKPAFGVYGNHCTPGYLKKFGIVNLHLKATKLDKYTIGGYQGCLKYKQNGNFQFTEEEAENDLANFPRVDILLLHAAPFGLLDTSTDPVHQGSKVVRKYVDRTKPKFIFCGHDSPSLEMDYQGTKIYRTHQTRLVDLNLYL